MEKIVTWVKVLFLHFIFIILCWGSNPGSGGSFSTYASLKAGVKGHHTGLSGRTSAQWEAKGAFVGVTAKEQRGRASSLKDILGDLGRWRLSPVIWYMTLGC
jgi:hypothetical protein